MDNYSALNGKLGFLRKGFLERKEYEEIFRLEKKEELIAYLSNNPLYKDQISEYRDHEDYYAGLLYNRYAKRYGFEFLINKSEVFILHKIKPFISVFHRDLIEALILKYEIEDLKLILRKIVEKESMSLEKEMLTYGSSKFIDHHRLSQCTTIQQFLDALVGTPFRHALYNVQDDDVKLKHFHIEMSLDNLYFTEIEKASKKLNSGDRKIVDGYFHTLIDIANIQWILRAKRFYHLTNEEIFNYSIRNGKVFRGERLKQLVYTQSVEEAVAFIRETGKFKAFNEKYDKDTMFHRINEDFYKKQNRLNDYQNNIGTFLKFYIIFVNQNKNLIRIAEMQKYSLKDKEDIRSYLIGL